MHLNPGREQASWRRRHVSICQYQAELGRGSLSAWQPQKATREWATPMAPDNYGNRALHRVRESGFPVSDWLASEQGSSPIGRARTSNPCPLPHPPPPPPGEWQRGLFPQLSWPGQQGTHPQTPSPSGFQWLLPNSAAAPGVKGMLSNLWNFFCRETSTFEFQIPFRPPEPAHCLQESAKSQSSLARAWRVLGDFSLFIFFSRWQGCKTPLRWGHGALPLCIYGWLSCQNLAVLSQWLSVFKDMLGDGQGQEGWRAVLKSLEPQPRLHSQDNPSPYLTLTCGPECPKGSRSHCPVSWVLMWGIHLASGKF